MPNSENPFQVMPTEHELIVATKVGERLTDTLHVRWEDVASLINQMELAAVEAKSFEEWITMRSRLLAARSKGTQLEGQLIIARDELAGWQRFEREVERLLNLAGIPLSGETAQEAILSALDTLVKR